MQNVLIVFSGKAHSGKSTAAKTMQVLATKNPPYGSSIYSFATALKTIATEYFDWDGDKELYYEDTNVGTGSVDIHSDGTQTDSWGRMPIRDKGRQLLINIGQGFRAIRPTIWVDYVLRKINQESANTTDHTFIIDDLRFRNELELVKKFKPCISIRLTRSSQLDIHDTSETDLDNSTFDYYVENSGDMEDLSAKLSDILEDIRKRYQ